MKGKCTVEGSELNRRKFHELLAGAFGGLVVGANLGCTGDKGSNGAAGGSAAVGSTGGSVTGAVAAAGEKHGCRGLNACKGQGAGGDNACAGQGKCANVAHHSCAGQNECKNLGGCGKTAGANECKGQGGCSVPMHEGAWETARKHFEERMKGAGKAVGAAPAKAG